MSNMRNRIFSVLLLVMCLAFTLAAKSDNNRDGNWWNRLPRSQKMSYTIGFMDGQTYAHLMYTAALLHGMADPKTGKYDANRSATVKEVERYADANLKLDFDNLTAGQLVSGLDKIYSDYRNMQIELSDAVLVVLRSIQGMSNDDMEKLLQLKRKSAAE